MDGGWCFPFPSCHSLPSTPLLSSPLGSPASSPRRGYRRHLLRTPAFICSIFICIDADACRRQHVVLQVEGNRLVQETIAARIIAPLGVYSSTSKAPPTVLSVDSTLSAVNSSRPVPFLFLFDVRSTVEVGGLMVFTMDSSMSLVDAVYFGGDVVAAIDVGGVLILPKIVVIAGMVSSQLVTSW